MRLGGIWWVPWAGLVAISAISLLLGFMTGKVYDRNIAAATYVSGLQALALPLGALLVGVLLSKQALEKRVRHLEHRILAHARTHLGWTDLMWGKGTEAILKETLITRPGTANPGQVDLALGERTRLQGRRDFVVGFGSATALGMAALVALSAWAIPATEVYLDWTYPWLNTAFITLLTWASIFLLGAFVALLRLSSD